MLGDNGSANNEAGAYTSISGTGSPALKVTTTANPGTGVYGIAGAASGLGASGGVVGDSNEVDVAGVAGVSRFGSGVSGVSGSVSTLPTPLGPGVVGSSRDGPGVVGLSNNGYGVHGQAVSGWGVVAGSRDGIGVFAAGGQAPLWLSPSVNYGAPTTGTHGMGEIFVDNTGAIFQCVAGGDFATATKPVFLRIGFNPLVPVRLCETFAGSGPPAFPSNAYAGKTIAAGGTLTVTLAGTLDSPVSQPSPVPVQASAVVFILQANSSGAGGLTIYPADVATAPTALSTVFRPNELASGEVTAKLGVGGSAGKIKILNRANTPTDVILDVTGFYS